MSSPTLPRALLPLLLLVPAIAMLPGAAACQSTEVAYVEKPDGSGYFSFAVETDCFQENRDAQVAGNAVYVPKQCQYVPRVAVLSQTVPGTGATHCVGDVYLPGSPATVPLGLPTDVAFAMYEDGSRFGLGSTVLVPWAICEALIAASVTGAVDCY